MGELKECSVSPLTRSVWEFRHRASDGVLSYRRYWRSVKQEHDPRTAGGTCRLFEVEKIFVG